MAIEWREYLATGVEEVDEQHRELFRRFNAFLAACDAGKGKDEVLAMLRFLDEYVAVHFAAEEKLQLKVAYPDYPKHRGQHQEFIGQLSELKGRFEDEGATPLLVSTTNRIVVGWLIDHISRSDRDLGKFIQKGSGERG